MEVVLPVKLDIELDKQSLLRLIRAYTKDKIKTHEVYFDKDNKLYYLEGDPDSHDPQTNTFTEYKPVYPEDSAFISSLARLLIEYRENGPIVQDKCYYWFFA